MTKTTQCYKLVSGILNENKVFFIQEEKFSLSIHKVLLPSGKNYFQGLIIYFQKDKLNTLFAKVRDKAKAQ